MNKPPPPPPPPPPAEVKEGTFIDDWLQQKSKEMPTAEDIRSERKEWFTKQCLFPTHLTDGAMIDLSPLLSLLHDQEIESDGRSHPSDEQATVAELRKIVSQCSTYKAKAIQNKKEFEYKSAALEKKKRSEVKVPPKPPDDPEFTPLQREENLLLNQIHGRNHNVCLARAVCQQRTDNLLSCWKSTNPRVMRILAEQGLDRLMCMDEREAVERCIGRSVQQVMKDILS